MDRFLLIALTVLVLSTSVFARDYSSFNFYVQGGSILPEGSVSPSGKSYRANLKRGPIFGGFAQGFINKNVGFEVSYDYMMVETEAPRVGSFEFKHKFKSHIVGVGLVLRMPYTYSDFFISGGPDINFNNVENISFDINQQNKVVTKSNKTSVGWQAKVGINLYVNKYITVGLLGGYIYNKQNIKSTGIDDDNINLSGSYVKGTLGLAF